MISMISFAQLKGTFTDQRDGRTYKTVKIGKQTWMAENLAFSEGNDWLYENKQDILKMYGFHYRWFNAKYGACPCGWHLPNDTDWSILFKSLGGMDDERLKMMKSLEGTYLENNRIKKSGLAFLPGGYFEIIDNHTYIRNEGSQGYWWSSSSSKFAYSGSSYEIYFTAEGVTGVRKNDGYEEFGYSVRCIKD